MESAQPAAAWWKWSGTIHHIALLGLALILLTTGCSVLHPRSPLPAELAGKATPVGYEAVRDWGDHFSPVLQESVLSALQKKASSDVQEKGKPGPIRYLALSGGGMNGAFGAGFLCGWSADGSRPEFDFVTGISAGSLLAPFAFLGPGQDPNLREIYADLKPEDLFRRKGVMRILRDDSAFDTAPLRRLLEKFVTTNFLADIAREHARGRRLWIGTVNLDARRPVVWDMGRIASSGRPDAADLFVGVMMASSALPGAFPPAYFAVEAEGELYDELHVDGGIARQAFAYGPVLHLDEIRHTLDERHREQPVELYIIRNGELGTHYAPVKARALPILMNSISTLTHYQADGDFYRMFVYAEHDKCSFNLTGIPADYRRQSDRSFDPAEMKRLFALGERMAVSDECWVHSPWDELKLPTGTRYGDDE